MILEQFKLDGKVAVVTGGGRGIGQAYAVGLAEAGADVAIVDVIPMDETIAAIQKLGRKAIGIKADLAKGEQRLAHTGKELHEVGIRKVARIVDKGAVAVEEDGGTERPAPCGAGTGRTGSSGGRGGHVRNRCRGAWRKPCRGAGWRRWPSW